MRLYLISLPFTVLMIWLASSSANIINSNQQRTFVVDYDNNQFLKDGEPFRFIAGSFHYFRSLPQSWQRKLRTMRSAGLNAVTTYVEWSLHNPKDGVYNWKGIADVERFIQLAAEEKLLVILRPGPYICAERDMVITSILQIYFHIVDEWVYLCNLCYFPGWISSLAFKQISTDKLTDNRSRFVI